MVSGNNQSGTVGLTLGPQPGRNVVEGRLLFGSGIATFRASGKADR